MLSAIALLAASPSLVFAHYMPWFESKPVSGKWGWHWTMGQPRDPDLVDDDSPKFASHYTPLLGAYDSGDPDLLESHVLLMKYSGIDGVFVDWYGTVDHYDYLSNHRHTLALIDHIKKAKLKFAIVYEDNTARTIIDAGKWTKDNAITKAQEQFQWVYETWMKTPEYLKIQNKPAFLVFGPQYFKNEDWSTIFGKNDISYFPLMDRRGPAALGGYGWPWPKDGNEGSAKDQDDFYKRAKEWSSFIPCTFPRFHDYYAQAKLHESYGRIEDRDGSVFRNSLDRALKSGAPVTQVVTWNDWGEGTQIEPSKEFGYRDLELLQTVRNVRFKANDLRLPVRLYHLRKKPGTDKKALDQIAKALYDSKPVVAEKLLNQIR